MISFEEAQQHVYQAACISEKETVSLAEATGRVIAEIISSDRDYPPFNRATMDGYAMNFSDVEKGFRKFKIVETIFAGQQAQKQISTGECYKIMTGSSVPPLSNIVIRKEDVVEVNQEALVGDIDFYSMMNIAKKGEDVIAGSTIFSGGTYCDASVVAMLAAIGREQLDVYKHPSVAIITTGNEIVEPSSPVTNVQVRNSNKYLLSSLFKKHGITPSIVLHAIDEPSELRKTFEQSWEADILVTCGAVSAGDADHIPMVLHQMGAENIFHKVAIKPGKPLWFGKRPGGKVIFALPGNPFSCLVNFTLFIEPYLKKCSGIKSRSPFNVEFGNTRTKRTLLDEFFPAIIDPLTGKLMMLAFNGSGDIRAGIGADGIARHPAELPVLEENSRIDFYPF